MAELYKIHEKNKTLYGKLETVAGTFEQPAATDATPTITMDGNVTYDTGSYQYLGDSLSRDEFTYVKDSFAEFSMETPQQVLGTLNAALTVAAVPHSTYFQISGGFIQVAGASAGLGSFADGTVFVSNTLASNDKASLDFREESAQDAITQKARKFYGCQASLDINASIGEVPKLKFNIKGNAYNPMQSVKYTPSYGLQFERVVAAVSQQTVVNAEIASKSAAFTTFGGSVSTITHNGNIAIVTTAAAHNLEKTAAYGNIRFVTIGGANEEEYNGTFLATITSATTLIYFMNVIPTGNATGTFTMEVGEDSKAYCINTANATNFFGFDLSRYNTSCEVGFDKSGVASDVSISVLEGKSPATEITGISSTTTTATVTAASHGLSNGNSVTIENTQAEYNGEYIVSGVTTDTFQVTIPSFTGTYTRDGTGRVVNKDFATFDPDENITKFYGAQIKFGEAIGSYITYRWDKLQIADVKEGKINNFLARDVTLRNTGKSFIIYE